MKKILSMRGQGTIEYVLLIALIAVIILGILQISGITLRDVYCRIVESFGQGSSSLCSSSYFADDFNDLKKWKIINGNWQIKNGKLCGGPGEGRIFADVKGVDNYVVNLQGATLDKGDGYGLYFRSDNYDKVSGYNFQYDPGYGGGTFLLRRWYQGNEFSPTVTTNKPGYDWYGEPHDIKMVVNGNTFTSYVDGNQVYSGNDATFPKGSGIGLRTWDNTSACFDSISVNPLP